MKFQPLGHAPTPLGHYNGKEWVYKIKCSCGWSGEPTWYEKDLYVDFTHHLSQL